MSSNVNHLAHPCVYGHIVSSYGERKSRLMKWLSKLFNGGASRRRVATGGQQPHSFGDDNVVLRAPSRSSALNSLEDDRSRANKEKELLDRAVALSLAEDLNKPNVYKWTTCNDEDQARTRHDNLNSAPYPPYAPRDNSQRATKNVEVANVKRVWELFGTHWDIFFHHQCFCCSACGYPITEHEIPTNGIGLIEYRWHPFWSQKYCPSHEHNNTARCCSCECLESWNTRYISLGDGRNTCLECFESAIMDTGFSSLARNKRLMPVSGADCH